MVSDYPRVILTIEQTVHVCENSKTMHFNINLQAQEFKKATVINEYEDIHQRQDMAWSTFDEIKIVLRIEECLILGLGLNCHALAKTQIVGDEIQVPSTDCKLVFSDR